MKRKLIGFCIFLFIISLCYSQQNFIPGRVLTVKGDTLRGLINYQNWDKNPLNISFRTDMDHDPVNYSPLEIQMFLVGNEIYKTAKVSLDESPYKTQDLNYNADVTYRTDTVFLQTLIQGPKSLYYYKGRDGREQFFLEFNSNFELLIYHRYLRDLISTNANGNSTSVMEDKRFIGQLSFYFMDCPDLQSQLKIVRYNKQSLTKLFRQYYDFMDTSYVYLKKTDETRAVFGVFAGLSVTKLKFSAYEDYHEAISKSDFPLSSNVAFGIYLNKKLSRNLGRFSLHNELLFMSFKTDMVYRDYVSENQYADNYLSLGGFFIKINNMLQYSIQFKTASVMLRAGVSNGWNINEINHNRIESVFYSTSDTEISPAIEDTRKYEIGILGAIGGNYKRFSLEIGYEQNNGISDLNTLKCSQRTYYFLVGYKI